jgi:adenosylmethionine-8-amino-7-oxononanoate aminotransferase
MLVNAGADVHAQGGYHGNALYAASAGGHEKVVQMLVDLGENSNGTESNWAPTGGTRNSNDIILYVTAS